MMDPQHTRWLAGNQAYLLGEVEKLRPLLEQRAKRGNGSATPTAALLPAPSPSDLPWAAALEDVCESYALSAFERAVLLFCVGVEMDARYRELCTQLGGSGQPTVGLVLDLLPNASWDALSAGGTLRIARLITLSNGETVTRCALRIEERVLYHLLGISILDSRLQRLLRVVPPPAELPPSQRALAEVVRRVIESEADAQAEWPAIWLCGPDPAARRAVAAWACAELGIQLLALRSTDVPLEPAEREALLTLWERELKLSQPALLLCCSDRASPEALQAAAAFLEQSPSFVLVSSQELMRLGERRAVRIDVERPSRDEQVQQWRTALGPAAAPLSEFLDQVVCQFRIGMDGIAAASLQALEQTASIAELPDALWEACCRQARPHLDELAQRIEPGATWEDLVLPEAQLSTLKSLVAHQRHQATVYHHWGFGRPGARGLGVSALFVGQSGTGKTLAAEVVARALRLDLYRIDLSQVVSKYIGETEKNLRRVFDAAEEGGAVLLFDEADALFGKRSEVKDSHDRYANMEISYLLQRMESYRGVSLLTSNMRSALDPAFVRRLRFIVQFPFPDSQQRCELWRRAFPNQTPTADLNLDKLARLHIAGGHIRNIALCAAFLAADEGMGQPVTMRHLLAAARNEYAKLERPLIEAEIGGWV